MSRRWAFCLLSLLLFTPARAAESLEGTWRQTTPKIGQSDWVLLDAGRGYYKAQEFGLGRAHGVAYFKDDTLTIDWRTDDGGAGVWEWKLSGNAGVGALIFADKGEARPGSVKREWRGQKVKAFEKSQLKHLPPPAGLVEVWKQNTPGLGESTWTLVKTAPDTFRARETGLGEMHTTAHRKDNVLKIGWKTSDEHGGYEWKLEGESGKGALMYVQGGPDLPGSTPREWGGKKVRAYPSSVSQLVVHADSKAPPRFSLPVKLVGQKTGCWCFAAATQMVLNYHKTETTQEELLNVFTKRSDCAQIPTPEPCLVSGGECSLLEHFGYTFAFRHGPLTPDELVREIYTRRKPLIFGWDYKKGGGHSLVAVGYARMKGAFLVEILNPSPIGEGERYYCTYQQWLEGADYLYQDSIFNITRPKSPAAKKE